MAKDHLLVVGAGSVGRRHARNFYSLECHVSCADPRQDRLKQVALEVPIRNAFSDLDVALQQASEFTGAVICSPPRFHVEQSLKVLDCGLPVLLEKPPSTDLRTCRQLERRLARGGSVLLGYSYRWWEPVRHLRVLLGQERIGKPLHAKFVMSAHLADWHPWERYQDFFMASKELGGGALLDESHFVDLMLWFFGVPDRLFARVEKLSNLEISTDDFVTVSAAYSNGLRVSIQLDLFGRPHEKQITVVGETGTLRCLFDPNEVQVGSGPESKWMVESFAVERNDMFMAEAKEFLEMIGSENAHISCTVSDGCRALEIVEACRKSQQTGCEVVLSKGQLENRH
jgi:predicted dehydrogenase